MLDREFGFGAQRTELSTASHDSQQTWIHNAAFTILLGRENILTATVKRGPLTQPWCNREMMGRRGREGCKLVTMPNLLTAAMGSNYNTFYGDVTTLHGAQYRRFPLAHGDPDGCLIHCTLI